MIRSISSFTGPYRFLSNFFPARVELDGVSYPTSEHAYQALKMLYAIDHNRVKAAFTPGQAKRLARSLPMKPGWEEAKLEVMKRVLEAKFLNPELTTRLLRTGDAKLVEGNSWGDDFWGVYKGKGHNHLGRLLMEVRASLARLQYDPTRQP